MREGEAAAGGEPDGDVRYLVEKSRLVGDVRLSGAKNSVLRLMAASLLTEEPVALRRYPAALRDAQIHQGMLEALGKTCDAAGDILVIREASAPPGVLAWRGRSIRNTLLILGALTARTGFGEVPMPGGCRLGDRKHDLHVMLLERLGARVVEGEDFLRAEAPRGLVGGEIRLPIRSTGATENALICASLARGRSVIWGPHIRPEILDLIRMLTAMGAAITVYGQERIEVVGAERLGGADHTVIPDNMEALTWMIGAAITGGEVEIFDFPESDLEVPLVFLRESGVKYYRGAESFVVKGGPSFPVEISTGPYPGINSDMQPLFAVFGAMSPGESRIVDLRFPGRYGYSAELARMGVDCRVIGDVLHVVGGGRLEGRSVTALDLRAGVALALAGMVAEGVTEIRDAWQVERGYDRFVDKLRGLGAAISVAR